MENKRIITENIEEFASVLPRIGVIISLDYGARKIGIAVTDRERIIASPLTTKTTEEFEFFLENFMQNTQVAGIVIGIPLDSYGMHDKRTDVVGEFAKRIHFNINLPILLVDERMTTRLAQTSMLYLGDFGKTSLIHSKQKLSKKITQNVSWKQKQGSERVNKKIKVNINTVDFSDDSEAACAILDLALTMLGNLQEK